MAIPFKQQPNSAATTRLHTSRVHVYFVPHGVNPDTKTEFDGADSTSSVPKGLGLVCSTQKFGNIKMEPSNTTEVKAIGKANYTYATGGKLSFSIDLESGDVNTLLVMQGKNPSSATANAYIARPIPHASGDLFIQYWNETTLRKSVYVPNCQFRVMEVAMGDGPDTEVIQTIEFFKDGDSETFTTRGTVSFAAELWKRISTGPNVPAAAPEGTIVDFVLGTSNMAGVNGTTSPVALKIDDEYAVSKYGASPTDFEKYMIRVSVAGVDQTSSQVTYTTGTRTLTFGTAPAAGASLMAIYMCDYATAAPPQWTLGPSTVVEAMKYPWGEYA